MSTFISGLTEAECCGFIGAEYWNKHAFQWCPPEKLAAKASGRPSIWLYRAPWEAFDQPSDDNTNDTPCSLTNWLQRNRTLLNERSQFNGNLLIINADRVRPTDLHARLDGTIAAQSASAAQSAGLCAPYEGLFGQLFNWSSPQYWDVLEALEAASWLPSGEPLFRNDCMASEEQLNSLLGVLHSHTQASRELHQLRQASDDVTASNHRLTQENNELRQEGELLLLQLHQVQEELEQYYLKNLELDKAAAAGKKAVSDMQNKLSQSQKVLAAAQQETKAMQLQLQQAQDELRHQQALLVASTAKPVTQATPLGRLVPAPARRMLGRAKDKKRRLAQLDAIRKSDWFDRQWYLNTYPDIRTARIDPAEHYLTIGWKESRNPSSRFDTAYYLRSNPDITQSGLNPLWHFIAFGSKEGRLPHKP